jgi:hypothetical protein
MADIKHFETLFEEAEILSLQKNKAKSTAEIIKEITELFNSYSEADTIDSKEISASLKHRYMGEALFLMTTLSMRDNINTYAALNDQMNLNKAG